MWLEVDQKDSVGLGGDRGADVMLLFLPFELYVLLLCSTLSSEVHVLPCVKMC